MNTNVIAIGLIAAALFWPQLEGLLGKVPGGARPNTPVVAPPDAAAQEAVAPVKQLLEKQPSRAAYRAYFRDFSEVIEKRPQAFATVGDVIAQHTEASKLFFDVDQQPPVDGLAKAIDGAIKGLLGNEDKAITPADATRLTRALEWSCQ